MFTLKVVAAAVIVVALPFVAYADTPDDQFANNLVAHGVPGDRQQLIDMGHEYCGSGQSGWPVTMLVFRMRGMGWTNANINSFMFATNDLCPQLTHT